MNYVVTAYRWGDREAHSYVVGVYSTSEKALEAAEEEEAHRGGNKYECEVLGWEVDQGAAGKSKIKPLKVKALDETTHIKRMGDKQ